MWIQIFISTTVYVISEPHDVTVCEGRSTTFSCVLDSSITSDDVQWYSFIKDTSTTSMVDQQRVSNTLTSSFTITDARISHTGYYWVRLPSDDVCNVSLTVGISMWIEVVIYMQCIAI